MKATGFSGTAVAEIPDSASASTTAVEARRCPRVRSPLTRFGRDGQDDVAATAPLEQDMDGGADLQALELSGIMDEKLCAIARIMADPFMADPPSPAASLCLQPTSTRLRFDEWRSECQPLLVLRYKTAA